MPDYLGIDTSNYTTSTALFSSDTGKCVQSKKLLPVKEGELGLRQSDAVFHHVNQFSELIEALPLNNGCLKSVGVSTKPRSAEGSYMPCFLVGGTVAKSIGAASDISVHETSHQIGHILAALYSCNRLDLVFGDKPFLAFHVSGGTTDCLLVTPDKENVLKVEEVATSLDLKAGQAVDRVGLMLGLKFPCGKELEKLAMDSLAKFKIKPTIKDGNCCLSGIENKCRDMLNKGENKCDIALYCLKYIEAAILKMTSCALDKYSDMPVIYAGGVMSNMIIRGSLSNKFEAYFASPEYSCDNACGVAIYAAIKDGYKL
ncbi:MAG: peptidase M22 [Oscillospiraceae bacterium]|nr:peptidase M22 [Oscillospiraceae bacterium]